VYDSIEAKNLVVYKGHEAALNDVTFSVKPSSITGLIGPSGAGKTTLMRAIVGAQKITKGTLTIFGDAAGARCLRSKIGYVPQEPAVYDDLTVYQNLSYFGSVVGASKAQVVEVIKSVQLQPKKDALISHLSGGQRARVSLAIALLGNPQLLILDEPTVGLDPVLREELWQLFESLATKGKTLLISSHVMDEAERCQQIILLRESKLLWDGSKNDLLKQTGTKTVEAAFLDAIRRKGVNRVSR